jgi:hypothetical protein
MPLGMFSYTPVPLNDRFGIWGKSLPGYTPPSPALYGAGAPLPGSTNSRVASTTGTGFNLNPQPTSGQGPHGAVPGQLGLPNPAADLAGQIPGLSSLNSAASSGIAGKLRGELSPGTLNALKNASAQFGVSSGMPGSGLSSNAFLGNVAGASEAQQAAGIQEYNSFIPTVSGTQTVSPALQNEIATQNSLNAAAPDPTQAASYAMQLFNMYLQQMGRGSGGGGGASRYGGGMAIPQSAGTPSRPSYSQPSSYVSPQSIKPVSYPGGTFGGASSMIQFDPQFNYQTSPWSTELYGTQQNIPDDFYWE